jgi:hypothetical protein
MRVQRNSLIAFGSSLATDAPPVRRLAISERCAVSPKRLSIGGATLMAVSGGRAADVRHSAIAAIHTRGNDEAANTPRYGDRR